MTDKQVKEYQGHDWRWSRSADCIVCKYCGDWAAATNTYPDGSVGIHLANPERAKETCPARSKQAEVAELVEEAKQG